MTDTAAKCSQQQFDYYWSSIWPEAVRHFGRCGIELVITEAASPIKRSPASRPVFTGLRQHCLNLVITNEIPLTWARGRGIAGVSTIWDGYHVSVIALDHAHPSRIPLLAVNTCVHELLHVFLQDIYVTRPSALQTEQYEIRVNWLATELWLFGRGSTIRQSAAEYLQLLNRERPA